jgi:hypothetical protein
MPAICNQAATIAVPLVKLKRKIDRLRGATQARYVCDQLSSIQSNLQQLFREQLDPLMGSETVKTTSNDEEPPPGQ